MTRGRSRACARRATILLLWRRWGYCGGGDGDGFAVVDGAAIMCCRCARAYIRLVRQHCQIAAPKLAAHRRRPAHFWREIRTGHGEHVGGAHGEEARLDGRNVHGLTA